MSQKAISLSDRCLKLVRFQEKLEKDHYKISMLIKCYLNWLLLTI